MLLAKSDLSTVRRRLARASECLELQQELIQKLRAGRQDTSHAEIVFRRLRRTLQACDDARRRIEDEVIAAKAGVRLGR